MGFERPPKDHNERFAKSFTPNAQQEQTGKGRKKWGKQDITAGHLAGKYILDITANHRHPGEEPLIELRKYITQQINSGSRGGTTNTITQLRTRIATAAGHVGEDARSFLVNRAHFTYNQHKDDGDYFVLSQPDDIGTFLKHVTGSQRDLGLGKNITIELHIDSALMETDRPLLPPLASSALKEILDKVGIMPMVEGRIQAQRPDNLLNRPEVNIKEEDGNVSAKALLDEWLTPQKRLMGLGQTSHNSDRIR